MSRAGAKRSKEKRAESLVWAKSRVSSLKKFLGIEILLLAPFTAELLLFASPFSCSNIQVKDDLCPVVSIMGVFIIQLIS